MNVFHIVTQGLEALANGLNDFGRSVSGIVQNLHLQQIGRIFHPAGSLNNTLGDKTLVIKRQLNGNVWKMFERGGSLAFFSHIAIEQIYLPIPVYPINGQDYEADKIQSDWNKANRFEH